MKSKYKLTNIQKMIKKCFDGEISSKRLAEEWAFEGYDLYDNKLRSRKTETSEDELCREILYNLAVDYDLLESPIRDKKKDREGVASGEVEFSKKYLQEISDAIKKFKARKPYKLPDLK